MPDPMRTVSFKLPEHLDEAVSELARKRKSSRSAVVREALQAITAQSASSVTATVDQLVGTVQGPADLSTHRRHMKGYGR